MHHQIHPTVGQGLFQLGGEETFVELLTKPHFSEAGRHEFA